MALIWLGNIGFLVCLTVGGVTVLCLWATLSTAKYWFNQQRLVQHDWKKCWLWCKESRQTKASYLLFCSYSLIKVIRLQRSGIDTIKYHTWPRIPMGKWQTHRRHHNLKISFIFLRFAQLTRAIDICWLSSVSTAELLVSLIQQAWIFQTDRIPSTHWALDICRLSSVSTAELLVSLIQRAWIFQTDRIPSTHWDLDICRLSSAFVAELFVSLIQQAWIFQADRNTSTHGALDICRLSSAFVAELLVSLIQQAWIFQAYRIPSTHWALDICRLSSAFVAKLLVSLIQQAWIFQSDRILSNSEAAVKEL